MLSRALPNSHSSICLLCFLVISTVSVLHHLSLSYRARHVLKRATFLSLSADQLFFPRVSRSITCQQCFLFLLSCLTSNELCSQFHSMLNIMKFTCRIMLICRYTGLLHWMVSSLTLESMPFILHAWHIVGADGSFAEPMFPTLLLHATNNLRLVGSF